MTIAVSITADATKPYRQTITAGNHTIVADVSPAKGGGDTGPSPHELALAGLGSCTAITLQMYAAQKGWDLQGITVNVTEEQVPDPANPKRTIPKITKEINVKGNLDDAQQQRLKTIAEKCPVNKLFTEPKLVEGQLNLVV